MIDLTIGDNIIFLKKIASESVDLIYLDSPYFKQKNFEHFNDKWDSIESFIDFMKPRIIECHRVLKSTGTIYVHLDYSAVYDIKPVMDQVFGRENFKNDIIWSYKTGGCSKKYFAKKHDNILFYTKSSKYTYNLIKEKSYTKAKGRKAGIINGGNADVEFFEDDKGVYNLVFPRDVWEISYVNAQAKERTGYSSQKPLKLLERIISASSNPGDLVLDPFAGSCTSGIASKNLGRNWIGCDKNKLSEKILKDRLK